ncbi:hypothetical protein BUALT_Bualt02G0112200 [Buddleja alternifolia]|uniref:Fe2OG dioxygenase domain-containing protein n=1 Tax=Buddleja alternifolia TaxID=168488 RepID=A0AAV6Y3J5_9LAMI|nr:hypothetical protein BUALT_Bualt02G0112200 [Buddleja alternifolia]
MVMNMVLSSYGLEKYCNSLIESSFYMKRLIKYKSQGENETSIGLLPHTDKTFMSIISTNEVKGLQIKTPQGEWIDFEPSPSKFILLVGEAFMAWSNGKVYCPLHRVLARGNKERWSIGIFCFIRGILQVPEELLDHENPLKFKPFSNLEFLQYCKLQGASTNEAAIQTYCGI